MYQILELQRIREKLGRFDESVRYFSQRYLTKPEIKARLIEYNQVNLDKGIRADLTQIEKTPVGGQKSTRYERYTLYLKEKRRDLFEPDKVSLSGESHLFREEIDIKVGADAIYFVDNNWKVGIIESIWGNVLGLTEEQLFEFTEFITPAYADFCLKYFND